MASVCPPTRENKAPVQRDENVAKSRHPQELTPLSHRDSFKVNETRMVSLLAGDSGVKLSKLLLPSERVVLTWVPRVDLVRSMWV